MSCRTDEPLARVDTGRLRRIRPREIALRFVFGAAISVVIGLISRAFGPRAAGMFLAFPAILPASVTLIEHKEGTPEAAENVAGAVFGGFGLIAFALTARALLTTIAPALALVLSFGAWIGVSGSCYLAYELLRRHAEPPERATGHCTVSD